MKAASFSLCIPIVSRRTRVSSNNPAPKKGTTRLTRQNSGAVFPAKGVFSVLRENGLRRRSERTMRLRSVRCRRDKRTPTIRVLPCERSRCLLSPVLPRRFLLRQSPMYDKRTHMRIPKKRSIIKCRAKGASAVYCRSYIFLLCMADFLLSSRSFY